MAYKILMDTEGVARFRQQVSQISQTINDRASDLNYLLFNFDQVSLSMGILKQHMLQAIPEGKKITDYLNKMAFDIEEARQAFIKADSDTSGMVSSGTISPETIKEWNNMNEAFDEEGTISNRILDGTFFHLALNYYTYCRDRLLIGIGDSSHIGDKGALYVTEDQENWADLGANLCTVEAASIPIGVFVNGAIGVARFALGDFSSEGENIVSSGMRIISQTSYVKSIEDLKNIENFNQGTKHNALKHIFEGEINAKTGQSMGFHYEGFSGCKGKIIGNLDQPNKFGVYRANVEIDGVAKGPKTTFFPKNYSPQEVVDAVNEAFANKEVYKNNIYRGKSRSGMEIEFVIKKGKIDSAYPLY